MLSRRVRNKIVVVTGASSGIGEAVALQILGAETDHDQAGAAALPSTGWAQAAANCHAAKVSAATMTMSSIAMRVWMKR